MESTEISQLIKPARSACYVQAVVHRWRDQRVDARRNALGRALRHRWCGGGGTGSGVDRGGTSDQLATTGGAEQKLILTAAAALFLHGSLTISIGRRSPNRRVKIGLAEPGEAVQ